MPEGHERRRGSAGHSGDPSVRREGHHDNEGRSPCHGGNPSSPSERTACTVHRSFRRSPTRHHRQAVFRRMPPCRSDGDPRSRHFPPSVAGCPQARNCVIFCVLRLVLLKRSLQNAQHHRTLGHIDWVTSRILRNCRPRSRRSGRGRRPRR